MRRAVWLALIPLLVAAQPPSVPRRPQRQSVQAPTYKPEELGSVEGQVTHGASGEPLAKAQILLRRSGGTDSEPRGYSAATDASGRFSIVNINPGNYRISASRNGFVDSPFQTVNVGRGEHKTAIQLRMIPHGVVTGRVLDEDGEPVEGIEVQARRFRYTQGRKQLFSVADGSTNDTGEFRLYGLPPGKYFLCAIPRRSGRPDGIVRQGPALEYVTTFYPGAYDVMAAAPVEIAAGTQLRGFDFTLAKRATVRIRGRVADVSGSQSQRVSVFLMPAGGDPMSVRRATSMDASGNFEIIGVPPGSYTLMAAVMARGASAAGRLPVQVGNADVEGLQVVINPPVTVAGRVRVNADTAGLNLAGMQVSLRAKEPGWTMFNNTPLGKVDTEGRFSIAGVNPDLYSVQLAGIPDGLYIKSITANGQDALGPGLDLAHGAGAVDIILNPNAAQATGVVQNDQQQPAAGVTVVLVPAERDRVSEPRYYHTSTTDASGRFSFRNLDPGEYKVFSWEQIESGAYMDPDFLQPYEPRAQKLVVREGSAEDIQVKLIS